jgi:hypothetical protein
VSRVALLALLVVACRGDASAPAKAPPVEAPIAVPGGSTRPIDAAVDALQVTVEGVAIDAGVDAAVDGKVTGGLPKRGSPADAGVDVHVAIDAAVTPCACTPPSTSTKERSRDAANHLRPEQGTLRVNGAEVTLTAATGWHIATDYNIKLYLEPSDGVSLVRAPLTAGGRSKASGDAAVLSEQTLTFRVTAGGKGEIAGILSFGICEADSCHPRLQPITISVGAN